MIEKLAAVIFDLDGTLSNTWPPAIDAFRAAITQFADRSFSDEELKALAGPAEDGILQALFPTHWEACFEQYLFGFEQRLDENDVLFPGISDTLEVLAGNKIPMAIVSGKTPRAVEMVISKTGISEHFHCVRGGSAKGDRKIQDLADTMKQMELDPSSVAYIGDTKGDIIAAKSVGVSPLGASWDPSANELSLHEAGAHRVFSKVNEFKSWCLEFNHQ